MDPDFLELGEVLRIHQDQLNRYGGDSGVRDLSLLQSALAQPSATYGGRFLHESIHEMAAAYLYGIVKNHPFVDGNKRVATVASLVFLFMNDRTFDASEDALTNLVMEVAKGTVEKAEVVLFFRRWTHEK